MFTGWRLLIGVILTYSFSWVVLIVAFWKTPYFRNDSMKLACTIACLPTIAVTIWMVDHLAVRY